jgi:hypothetical protein
VRGSNAEAVDPLRKVVLVIDMRNNDLCHAAQRGGRGGTRAAMVDDGRDPSEEGLQVHLVDRQAVGCVVQG